MTLQAKKKGEKTDKSAKSVAKDDKATKFESKDLKASSLSKIRCFNCGKCGHFSTECDQKPRAKGSAFKCGSLKHVLKDCPQQGQKREKEVVNLDFKNDNKFYKNGDTKLKNIHRFVFSNHTKYTLVTFSSDNM